MRIVFTKAISETLQRKGPSCACGKMRLYTWRPWYTVKCKMTIVILDLTELSSVLNETVF